MKDLMMLPGQMDILSFISSGGLVTAEAISSKPKVPCKKVASVKSIEDYLQKGERIETLAKEWYKKKKEELSIGSLDEYIAKELQYDFTYPTWYSLHEALSKVFRGILRKMEKCEEGDPYYGLIRELKTPFELTLVKGAVDSAARRLRYSYQRQDDQLNLNGLYTNPKGNVEELNVYSYHTVKYSPQVYHWSDGSSSGRIEELLACMYMVEKFNETMNDKARRAELEGLFGNKTPSDKLMSNIFNTLLKASGILRMYRKTLKAEDVGKEPDPKALVDAGAKFFSLDPADPDAPNEAELKIFCDYLGIDLKKCESIEQGELGKFVAFNQAEYTQSGKPYGYALVDEVCRTVVREMSFLDAYDKGALSIKFDDCLSWSSRHRCFFPQMSITGEMSAYTGSMAKVLSCVMEAQRSVIQTKKYYEELEDTHKSRAKVYQTKKNIPQRTIKAMEESELNKVFGYVEYDELVDLKKVQILIDQFLTFREQYMSGFDTSNVQIRFRKLGNHKASGLYFPFQQCICVDVGKPDSLVHEYAHCFDATYEKGKNLSDRAEFAAIRRLYGARLKQALKAEGKSLSGKYDLSYYLTPTEIFARCFEIYCVRILKLDCSICKPDDKMGFAYPVDAELEELVKAYFDRLLVTVGAGGMEESMAAA